MNKKLNHDELTKLLVSAESTLLQFENHLACLKIQAHNKNSEVTHISLTAQHIIDAVQDTSSQLLSHLPRQDRRRFQQELENIMTQDDQQHSRAKSKQSSSQSNPPLLSSIDIDFNSPKTFKTPKINDKCVCGMDISTNIQIHPSQLDQNFSNAQKLYNCIFGCCHSYCSPACRKNNVTNHKNICSALKFRKFKKSIISDDW